MKKNILRVLFITLLTLLAIFNYKSLANNTYKAPIDFSTPSLFYIKSWGNRECIAGNSTMFELIDGKQVEIKDIPKIVLQSTDGLDIQWVYVEKRGNNFYFDIDMFRLDFTKSYEFKVKSNNVNNTADFQTLLIKDGFISIPSLNTYITIKDNIISLSNKYQAPIDFSTPSLFYIKSWGNRECIAGNSTMFELIDGKQVEIKDIPKIVLQSTDGLDIQWVYVEKRGNNFYFDIDMFRLDFTKSYEFKVKSNNINNTSEFQTLHVKDNIIGVPSHNLEIEVKNNTINISKPKTNLTAEEANLYFIESGDLTYIAGLVPIYEQNRLNYKFSTNIVPKMQLVSNDNSIIKDIYVEKIDDRYFFSTTINNIDFSKTYFIKVLPNDRSSELTIKEQTIKIKSIYNNLYKYFATFKNDALNIIQIVFPGIYGQSGLKVVGDSRGTDLKYYKIGNGPNVLFAVFAMHGYEDLWPKDGYELTIIAEDFVKKLASSHNEYIMNNWTIYVFPQANPDGLNYGYTQDGPGRCTVTGKDGIGVDFNRCWSTEFAPQFNTRNYTGKSAFGAYEAEYLRDFLIENKSKTGQTILIDLHGWTTQLIGDRDICLNYYGPQFYSSNSKALSRYTSTYGKGYLIHWAKTNLNNNYGVGAKSALIELPSAGIYNHQTVVDAKYSEKYYNATVNMLKGILSK